MLTGGENEGGDYEGLRRGIGLARLVDDAVGDALDANYNVGQWDEVRKDLAKIGVFVNRRTLEDELLTVGYQEQFLEVYEELGGSQAQRQNMKQEIDNGEITKVIRRIERTGMGKGRFAQRLADKVDATKVPPYIEEAIRSVLQKAAALVPDQAPSARDTAELTTNTI